MFDRLVDIERRQIETEEWEDKRFRGLRRRGPRASSAVLTTSTKEAREKKCCSLCLQPACVGDCPTKRNPLNCCDNCHQPLCTGSCKDTRYEQRMRLPRDESSAALPPRPLGGPRSCKSCHKKHTAKLINANNVVLGRPTSAFSTYTRGRHSAKPKTDLRPSSAANVSDCISKGIERLGIDPVRPPPPSSAKSRRPRSRGDIIPGKTYFSNLSRSLTDLSHTKKKKRSKSAKSRSGRTSAAS